MRNRPKIEKTVIQKFLEIPEQNINKEDLHRYVKKSDWPIINPSPSPCFADGSTLKKPLLIYLNEIEWNSIDRHTKTLGISKQEWIKHAIYYLLEEEQNYFLREKNNYII